MADLLQVSHGVFIRPYLPSDLDALIKHANNEKIANNLKDSFPFPYTRKSGEDWLAKVFSQEPRINFAIATKQELVGGIGVIPREDVYRKMVGFGYWLGEDYWGRGIATEAVKKFVPFVFQHFDIVRIEAHVYEWNRGSVRVLEKSGFNLDGVLRKAVTKKNRIGDCLIYSVLHPSYSQTPHFCASFEPTSPERDS